MTSLEIERASLPRLELAPGIVESTKAYLEMHRRPLREESLAGKGGVSLAGRVAKLYDGLLSAYFCGALAKTGLKKERVALLAVGGYGRRTLGLGSDLDVVVLGERDDDPRLHQFVETLLYPLWDSGVAVGHAVRTPEEFAALARGDLRTATAVLDARVLAGDEAFATESVERGWRSLFDGEVNLFIDALREEMAARHARYGASVYLLEPDVKHGRGALRDLDIACWALGARYRAKNLADALQRGFLSTVEAAQLGEAREFFWRVRAVLHGRSGRRSDRLTFDEQEECGRVLAEVAPVDDGAVVAAAEQLMQQYYRHARTVATTLDLLLDRCRTARATHERLLRAEKVADGIDRYDGALSFSDPTRAQREPAIALRMVERAIALDMPIASGGREVIARCAGDAQWCERLRADSAAGPLFCKLLGHAPKQRLRAHGASVSAAEQGEGSVLAELHDLGLLLAMIPEFGAVTGKVHHDVYHVYTVDVHSVAAVDRLHELARGELGEAYGAAARVLADIERRDLLVLATLLHDVGKGWRGRDHAVVGEELSLAIGRRLGLQESDVAEVAWLVRQHLALYHVATRRDLGDPATIEPVAKLVGDVWRLRALYLLTVADLSTTSPTSMTSWKARMLDELLRRTEEALCSGGAGDDDEALRARVREAAGESLPAVERFLRSASPRYLRANVSDVVVRHARVLDGESVPFVHVSRAQESAELVEVLVAAPDRPGLLARLASLLFANRLDVQSAQLYSRTVDGSRQALDVFTARRLDDDPGGLERLAARLPSELRAVLEAKEDPAVRREGVKGFRRAEPAVATRVTIDNDASGRFTVIEVFSRDRPGFLHAIADALYRLQLSIASAKVSTEGRRVADVFYVVDVSGEKLGVERFDSVRAALVKAAGD